MPDSDDNKRTIPLGKANQIFDSHVIPGAPAAAHQAHLHRIQEEGITTMNSGAEDWRDGLEGDVLDILLGVFKVTTLQGP